MFGATMGKGPVSASWKLRFVVSADAVDLISDALEPFVMSVTSFGDTPDGPWTVEAYAADQPEPGALASALRVAAAAAGIDAPQVQVEPLVQVDWLTVNRDSFQPLRAGSFFVHPSHYVAPPPPGAFAICVDAATAFGSGTHGSTFGCLLAIDRLLPRIGAGRLLDVGCGSGILSIAMTAAGAHPVLAADIDPEAVRVCRANARSNGAGGRVQAVWSVGLRDRRIAAAAPYPLIVANILARPLMMMASAIARNLRDDGYVVLSGLLVDQEPQVLGAYRRCGLVLDSRITVNGWRTLILRR